MIPQLIPRYQQLAAQACTLQYTCYSARTSHAGAFLCWCVYLPCACTSNNASDCRFRERRNHKKQALEGEVCTSTLDRVTRHVASHAHRKRQRGAWGSVRSSLPYTLLTPFAFTSCCFIIWTSVDRMNVNLSIKQDRLSAGQRCARFLLVFANFFPPVFVTKHQARPLSTWFHVCAAGGAAAGAGGLEAANTRR